ncbi:hypothetical protein J4573_24425 [Actinomadura barringtoniae]|uniref:Uncharacterized protein n=1 Tax=Actinomadura barringtoniae TaxID=1427535 RepID=A0A939PI70_9ACTN|nr:hypothetical protein [Actinomadura barringtoniae]MBO2450269.1 hypothetical protein [Actinomadura barringtoniae]
MSGGLSCYTGNLVAYLERHEPDPAERVARSIRVAVRTDAPGGGLAISHHAQPLQRLPDGGGELRYQGAADRATALREIEAELDAHQQALVVADSALLPWSAAPDPDSAPDAAPDADSDAGAPHYLLVNDRKSGYWHVIDRFAALLPGGGEQQPFGGWLTDEEFAWLLRPLDPLPLQQRRRNEHAFGFPVPIPPDGRYQWLARVPDQEGPAVLPGQWLTDPSEALDHLGQNVAEELLEDIWAVAQHHIFRYGHLADDLDGADEALAAWGELPRAVRFAHESAKRGRSRDSLLKAAFDRLARIEDDLREPLAARGYGVEHSDQMITSKGEET